MLTLSKIYLIIGVKCKLKLTEIEVKDIYYNFLPRFLCRVIYIHMYAKIYQLLEALSCQISTT